MNLLRCLPFEKLFKKTVWRTSLRQERARLYFCFSNSKNPLHFLPFHGRLISRRHAVWRVSSTGEEKRRKPTRKRRVARRVKIASPTTFPSSPSNKERGAIPKKKQANKQREIYIVARSHAHAATRHI